MNTEKDKQIETGMDYKRSIEFLAFTTQCQFRFTIGNFFFFLLLKSENNFISIFIHFNCRSLQGSSLRSRWQFIHIKHTTIFRLKKNPSDELEGDRKKVRKKKWATNKWSRFLLIWRLVVVSSGLFFSVIGFLNRYRWWWHFRLNWHSDNGRNETGL